MEGSSSSVDHHRGPAEVLRLLFRLPRGHFLDRRDFSLPGDFLQRLFQELEVCHPVHGGREEEHLLRRARRLQSTITEVIFRDDHISILPVDLFKGLSRGTH